MMQNIGQNLLGNSIAIGIIHASGISERVKVDNQIADAFKNGVVLSTAEDIVDWWMLDNSLIQNGRYQDFLDRSIFNGVAYTGVQMSGLDYKVYEIINGSVPVGEKIASALTNGAILTAIKTAGETWENSGSETAQRIMHPTRLLMN